MAKSATKPSIDPLRRWSVADALETYGLSRWGSGYFSVNDAGNITVTAGAGDVDVKVLVDDLARRGIQMPLMLRFSDLLRSRIRLLNEAFTNAIDRKSV